MAHSRFGIGNVRGLSPRLIGRQCATKESVSGKPPPRINGDEDAPCVFSDREMTCGRHMPTPHPACQGGKGRPTVAPLRRYQETSCQLWPGSIFLSETMPHPPSPCRNLGIKERVKPTAQGLATNPF